MGWVSNERRSAYRPTGEVLCRARLAVLNGTGSVRQVRHARNDTKKRLKIKKKKEAGRGRGYGWEQLILETRYDLACDGRLSILGVVFVAVVVISGFFSFSRVRWLPKIKSYHGRLVLIVPFNT